VSAPSDLAALADCKAWLGLTSTTDDALLAGLITAVSRAILADLGRIVLSAPVTETVTDGSPLRQWPVTALLACSAAGVALPTTAYALEPADPAPPGRPQRLILFPPWRGHRAVVASYQAGYAITGEAASVPTTAPFTVAAQVPYGDWASDLGVDGATGGYAVSGGTYTFPAAAAGAAVTLNYGYVPADLARAAVEWVADRYASRTRIGQSARTLGGQETASFLVKAMPDVVDRLLQPYRRVAG
jgi:hypothetical protein